MSTVRVRGESIFYVERASPDARVTPVMIHGSGGTHRVWLAVMNLLKQAWCIALDLPGHGRSGGRGRDTIADYADLMLDFLDAMRIKKAVLIGNSLGGAVALDLALRQDKRVAGLVLIGTGARLRVKPEFLAGIGDNFEETVHVLVSWFYGPQAKAELVKQGELELRASLPPLLFKDFSACDRFDVMERLGEIRVPTLVICGEEDRLTPRKYSEYLREHISGARLVIVPRAGHMVMIEKPQEVAGAVREFLREFSK